MQEQLRECLRQRECLSSQLQAVESYVEILHREVKALRESKKRNLELDDEVSRLRTVNEKLVSLNQKLITLVSTC